MMFVGHRRKKRGVGVVPKMVDDSWWWCPVLVADGGGVDRQMWWGRLVNYRRVVAGCNRNSNSI